MRNLLKYMAFATVLLTAATSCSDSDGCEDPIPDDAVVAGTKWIMSDADNELRQARFSTIDYLKGADDGSCFYIIDKDGSIIHVVKTANISQVSEKKPLGTRAAVETRADDATASGSTYVTFTLTKTDGSTVSVATPTLYVTQDGEGDNWKLGEYSVSELSSVTVGLATDGYEAPTDIADNYVDAGLAGWESRSQWNLANVHDPTVMLAEDGYYYMYQTDASYGNAHAGNGHFFCRRSKDLVHWEFLGSTMEKVPSWIQPKLNEIRTAMGLGETSIDFNSSTTEFGYWAPCARKVKSGLYRMYYAITMPGYINGENSWGERAFIGMMETSDPSSNTWEDKGYVITNVSDRGLNFNVSPSDYSNCYFKFNAIDPSYIITESGEHWLIYGSWHSGIAAVQLDAETGMPATTLGNPWGDDITAYGKRIFTRDGSSRWQGSEAPEVVYHDGYYYLFLAYDELAVAYNTRVVRSKNIDGPYENILGVDVTDGGDALPMLTHPYKFASDEHGWVGISHCAVFDDGQGNWFYASQQRFPADWDGNAYSNAIMQGTVRRIIWTESGWPVVMPESYGNVPQRAITEDEIKGKTFKHISFSYKYGQQCEAVDLTLNSDNTISSTWNDGAAWSFDEDAQTLTISGVTMSLARETDWEADDRHATIVYAGINGSKGMPYWGKMEF